MASSVSTDTMNPVICIACGLNMTETPKIRRNLGSKHKGSSIEVCERVLRMWKELALAADSQIMNISEEHLRMCRTCFNDYDKFAVKREEVEKKLQGALIKLYLIQGQLGGIVPAGPGTQLSTSTDTQLSTPGRKRPSECAHPVGIQKQVTREEPPLVLSDNTTSPFATVS